MFVIMLLCRNVLHCNKSDMLYVVCTVGLFKFTVTGS